MYTTKQKIYLYLDKTQKSMICTFLRAFVKQNTNLSPQNILDKFIDNQSYYLKINNSRFPFLEKLLNDQTFLDETITYICACKKYYEYKIAQAPLIAKQKEFEKNKRKFLQQIKMSKEPPTKKQLYYYDKLCKKYNLSKKDTTPLSKLDLKNEIESILNEHSEHNININK
jgi:hypothetical protein